MSQEGVAATITELLGLSRPPIGVSFLDEPPEGISTFSGAVPSACALWREAEVDIFYASSEAHFGCAVGALTMGFDLPPEVHERLMDAANLMCTSGYIAPEEIEKLPSLSRPKAGIVYGPLSRFTSAPDLILMWLLPSQAMVFNEATDAVNWTLPAGTVFGRPACSALPTALDSDAATLSMGCMGMRTFTEISDDALLAVLPGDRAASFAEALATTAKANETMQAYYEERKRALA